MLINNASIIDKDIIDENHKMGQQIFEGNESFEKLLERLQDPESETFRSDIQQLVSLNYDKMVSSLVHRGADADLAVDIVQDFVLKKLMDRSFLAKIDFSRGRFEGFLHSCLYRFFIDQLRKNKKEEENLQKMASDTLLQSSVDPSNLRANCRWALGIFGTSIRKLRQELYDSGNEVQWSIFSLKYIRPIINGDRNRVVIPMAQLADQLGIHSVKRLEYLWNKTRNRFVQIAQDEIRSQSSDSTVDIYEQFERLKEILVQPVVWLENWKELLPEDCHWNEVDLPSGRWSKATCGGSEALDVRELFGAQIPHPPISSDEAELIWAAIQRQPFRQFLQDYLPEVEGDFEETPVLQHMLAPNTPIEHYNLIRKATKNGSQGGEFPYLATFFHMLYAVSISVAFNRHATRITRMSDSDIVTTLQYALQQPWIPQDVQREIEMCVRNFIESP